MYVYIVDLLVTSEDRDDGGAADHGEVPSKGCQMTDIRVMVGHLQEDRAMASQGTVSEANV